LEDSRVKHLEGVKIFTNKQHGFTKRRSCLTNLLETFEEFTKALDEDFIYLDFRKAFDAVSHKKLLKKVKACGTEGNLLE
jgi:Reverse transcriptase (RNA-dependent DNA polymerase)